MNVNEKTLKVSGEKVSRSRSRLGLARKGHGVASLISKHDDISKVRRIHEVIYI